jgi:predicted restriction endonuclease
LYIGHSGRIGGGGKGIGKNAFLAFYQKHNASGTETIQWPDGKAMPLIVIGKVSSPNLLSDIAEFISAVETFKDKTKSRDVGKELDQDAEKAERQGKFEPGSKKESMAKTLLEVNLRRGQPAFRKTLLKAYGGRCAISGCDCADALEAAHIRPYGGDSTNHVQNGLLLRGDLHTLFDIGKIGVDPNTRRVVVASSLVPTVYGKLSGKRLRSPSRVSQLANPKVLRERLERWGLNSKN